MKKSNETPETVQTVFPVDRRIMEVFRIFLRLGMTSFGGPIAHLGFFQREFVERRKWIAENGYGDLVALCQFLPGPASSQVAISLGYLRAGVPGAFAAWVGFTMPSALLMIAAAYGFQAIRTESGFLYGLMIAAAAVVAQALWNMGRKFCPDLPRIFFAAIAACLILGIPLPWLQIPVLAAGALFGRLFLQEDLPPSENREPVATGFARLLLVSFLALLIVLPVLAQLSRNRWFELADAFYRSGALVFGGGHVVLPLLESATVARGWLNQNAFMSGYGAAQAVPGPLFSFAAYLGTVIEHNGFAGVWCLLWIYLPSFLLILAALPYWSLLRRNRGVQAALRGANATVVGILFAAFCNPVLSAAIKSVVAVLLACIAFALLMRFKAIPTWLLVLGCGAAGELFLRG